MKHLDHLRNPRDCTSLMSTKAWFSSSTTRFCFSNCFVCIFKSLDEGERLKCRSCLLESEAALLNCLSSMVNHECWSSSWYVEVGVMTLLTDAESGGNFSPGEDVLKISKVREQCVFVSNCLSVQYVLCSIFTNLNNIIAYKTVLTVKWQKQLVIHCCKKNRNFNYLKN